ncbi:MAG: TonB-dependent receptor [Saprospiraceae bacterium]|nr:TonB-dependent receptor [Candidatus Opimibacter skivensis]
MTRRILKATKLHLTSSLILLSLLVTGQNLTITGTVLSGEDQQPLIGVNVVVVGTQDGTITDFNGVYTVSAPADAVLQFSYTGFVTQDVNVGGRITISLTLEPDNQLLEDVVVVGYKKEIKSNISSAISTVKAENINHLPLSGLDQALQGQAAGVQVTQTTGAPGDDIAVRIRGAGTLGNNNPLYIIDGVPTTGNINMFSISDIESIEILKDAASASIYGSRSANGVIVITTKKGKKGTPVFNFDSYYGIQEANRLPDLLNTEEYLLIRNEAINNANSLRDPIRQLDTYDVAILDTLGEVNWLDEVFNSAPTQRYSLSASGGGDNGSFYLLGEYSSQEGVFKRQRYDKYLLRFNGDIGTKKFRVGNNISFSYTDRDVINSSGDGGGPGNELSGIRYALIAAPVFPIYDQNGNYNNTSSTLGDPTLYGDGNANPLAFIDATNWTVQRYRFFGNVFAEYKFLPNLTFRTNLGADILFQDENIFKERLSAAIYDPTSLSRGNVTDRTMIWNNTLDYSTSIGASKSHNVSLLIGMEAIENRTDYLGASARNYFLSDPNFQFIDNSVTQELGDIDASGIATEWGLMSYFAQAGYNYKSRYILSGSVRRDGSSRFGKANRYAVFPAISAAWNVSGESFFDNIDVISHLKLRASWGQQGNQEIGIYPYSSLVETGIIEYPFGGQISTGTEIVETGNENIKWETTTQTDFGMDMSLWDDRLSIIADYYIKRTDDILVRVPLPQSAGAFTPPYVNAGTVENKGLEFALSYRNSFSELHYNIGANIATIDNKVISIAGTEPLLGGFGLSDGPITRTEPGYPLGSFYLYEMQGIFQTQEEIDASAFQADDTRPGDVRFADLNGDNVINDDDRAHVGNPFPDFTLGFTLGFQYKNFDFSVLVQGVFGNDVYFLYGNFAYETQLRGFNSYAKILDRWTPTNTDTDIPKVSVDDRNNNRRISTRFLEDGSYVRVRNVTLGYTFNNLLKTDKIKELRLYVSAQNLFTFTKYSGLDPEIQANTNDTAGYNVSSDLAVGIDWGTVPAPRTILVGMNIKF